MRPPEEIREEIEKRLAIFKAGASIRFDVQPETPLVCDAFSVVKVLPLNAEEEVHWFLGYAPTFHTDSRFGAARVVKVLNWKWGDEYEVDLELEGSVMNGAKKMRIELLMPDSSRDDQILKDDLDRWREDKAYAWAGTPEVLKERFDGLYRVFLMDQ